MEALRTQLDLTSVRILIAPSSLPLVAKSSPRKMTKPAA